MDPVECALGALRVAWKEACIDYGARKLNSERSLQAALYFHMRSRLEAISPDFRIFIEAVVVVPAVPAGPDRDAESQRVIAIDTLVCLDRTILLAVEIKYTPRGFPNAEDLRKDLTSLDQIRNRRGEGVRIELKRHRDTEVCNSLPLRISPDARMALGIFCSDSWRIDLADFWEACRPRNAGRWDKSFREHLPPKLGLCIAYAPDPSGKPEPARSQFLGRPFADPDIAHIRSRFSGAVGPAFDQEDLDKALAAGDRTVAACSERAPDAETAARAAIVAAGHLTQSAERVVSVLALVQCPRGDGMLSAVKAVSRTLCVTFGDAHLVTGGVAQAVDEVPGIAVTLWTRVNTTEAPATLDSPKY